MLVRAALTIAGSDSSGGAGIQADIKTMSALGIYSCTVITAITAQNTLNVNHIHPLDADTIKKQIRSVLSDIPIHGDRRDITVALDKDQLIRHAI